MTVANPGFAKALDEERVEWEARRDLVVTLLTPMAAAVTKRGKPVFEPAAAVARAVAVADALIERIEADCAAAFRSLMLDYEAEGEEE